MKLLRSIIIFSLSIIALGSAGIEIPQVQDALRKTIAQTVQKYTDKEVEIGKIHSLFPFYFSADDIRVANPNTKKQELTIDSINFIPAWHTIIFGKIGFYHLGIHHPVILDTDTHTDISALFQQPVTVTSFICTGLQLDREYLIKGSLYIKPKRQYLRSMCLIEYGSGSSLTSSPANSALCTLLIQCGTLNATIKVNAFSPVKQVAHTSFEATLHSQHPHIAEFFWKEKTNAGATTNTPLCTGTGRVWALLKDTASPIEIQGSYALDNAHSGSCTIQKVQSEYCTLAGPLHVCAAMQDNALTLTAQSNLCEINTQVISRLSATTQLRLEAEKIVGATELHAILASLPLSLHAAWDVSNAQQLQLHECTGAYGKTAIQSTAKVFLAPFLIQGKIIGTSKDLSEIGALFGTALHGKAQLTAQFDVDDEKELQQRAQATLQLTDAGTTSCAFEHAVINATFQGSLPMRAELSAGTLAVDVNAQNGFWKHFELNSVELGSRIQMGDVWQNEFCIATHGKMDAGPFACACKGCKTPTGVRLSQGRIKIGDTEGVLTNGFSYRKTSSEIVIEPFECTWNNGGSLQGQFHSKPGEIQAQFHASNVPVEAVHFVMPHLLMTGCVSGDVAASLHGQKLRVHGQLGSNALTLQSHASAAQIPLQVNCQCDADNDQIDVHAEIGTDGQNPLQVELQVPIEIDPLSKQVKISSQLALKGKIAGKIHVEPLLAPYLNEDECIEGELTAAIDISGTVAHPSFTGKLSCSNGKLDIFKTGGLLSDIAFDATLKNRQIDIHSMTATDEKVGKVVAKGFLQLEPAKAFPFSLHMNVDTMEIVRRDFATTTASGTIALTGNCNSAMLSGNATIDAAELNIAATVEDDITPLNVMFINEPLTHDAPSNPFVLQFDIDFKLPPKKGMIIGRGLTSYWEGSCKLYGPHTALCGKGKITATHGTCLFGGKEFVLTEGLINCNGEFATHAHIHLTATHDFGPFQVALKLNGQPSKPKITFTSTRGLQEREILSWILFNKPLADISPLEALQLTNLIVNSKQQTQFNLLDKIKKSFGIEIDVAKTDLSGNNPDAMNIQVGKYISKQVMLRLSKDMENAANRVGIEASLQKDLSVQAEVSDDQTAGITLKWKHDY